MRSRRLALLGLVSLCACATPTRIIAPFDDSEVPFARLVDDLATADVVVFGEQHDSVPVHRLHQQLLSALFARRGDVVITMEMFERDVQPALWQYLLGDIDESEFLAKSRPWGNYARDYRPVIEFARKNRLEVLAANAPQAICRKVGKEGPTALEKSPFVARSTTQPRDDYWVAFKIEMAGHAGADGEQALARMYAAQCLKDDTMAETIADRLERAATEGRKPLVVHFCGHFHSDHRRGTVARLLQRAPDLRIKVLGVENVPPEHQGTTASSPSVADYVLQVPKEPESPEASPRRPAAPATNADKVGTTAPAQPAAPLHPRAAPTKAAPAKSDAAQDAPRPGLGLMPDYAASAKGVTVAEVMPDGAAAKAGIVADDVIVALAGQDVDDVAGYAAVLADLEVGQKVAVTVRRGDRTLQLQAVVGQRSR